MYGVYVWCVNVYTYIYVCMLAYVKAIAFKPSKSSEDQFNSNKLEASYWSLLHDCAIRNLEMFQKLLILHMLKI